MLSSLSGSRAFSFRLVQGFSNALSSFRLYEAANPRSTPVLVKVSDLFEQEHMGLQGHATAAEFPQRAWCLAQHVNHEVLVMKALHGVRGIPQLSCQLKHQTHYRTMR